MVNSSKRRLEWLDAVKGICIILIMASHYCNIPYIGYYLFAGYVQVFFIASGYTLKDEINKEKILKRIKRILIPYFFWGVFFCILLFLFRLYSFEGLYINLKGLIYSRCCLFPINSDNNIFLLGPNNPLWFLTGLLCATFLSYLYFAVKKTIFRLILIGLYIALTIIFDYLPILLPWSIDTAFIGAIFIIIGFYVKQKAFFALKSNALIIVSFTIVYIFLVMFNPNINMSVREYGDNGILLFALIGFFEFVIFSLIFQLVENSLFTRTLSKIGKSSLRILCIHYPVFLILSSLLANYINLYIISLITGIGVLIFAVKTESQMSKYQI